MNRVLLSLVSAGTLIAFGCLIGGEIQRMLDQKVIDDLATRLGVMLFLVEEDYLIINEVKTKEA